MEPPIHPREKERLEAVHRIGILDSEPDPKFDAITEEAIEKLNVPISTVSIIDEKREWYKSCRGLPNSEGPREIAFCSYALLAKNLFIVEDTLLDPRFMNNPYVTAKPFIRFYAGIALLDAVSGLPIGVFCVKDTRPRKFSMKDIDIFLNLGEKATQLINSFKK